MPKEAQQGCSFYCPHRGHGTQSDIEFLNHGACFGYNILRCNSNTGFPYPMLQISEILPPKFLDSCSKHFKRHHRRQLKYSKGNCCKAGPSPMTAGALPAYSSISAWPHFPAPLPPQKLPLLGLKAIQHTIF